jgi:hypothetical protein
MRKIIIIILLLSQIVWWWYAKNLSACSFAQGIKEISPFLDASGVKFMRGVASTTWDGSSPLKLKPIVWQPAKGDYRSCIWVFEEL